MPPRVLLLTETHPQAGVGGVETFSRLLTEVFPEMETISSKDLPERARLGYFREYRLAVSLGRLAAARHARRPYDLMIVNGSLAMCLPGSLDNVPVAVVFHGNYAGYSRRGMRKKSYKTAYTRLLAAGWERASARRADCVIAVSSGVKEDVRRYYGRESAVIPNGVRISPKNPPSPRLDQLLGLSGPRLLFVGRATWEKGYDRLLRLAEAHPRWLFLVASPGLPRHSAVNIVCFTAPDRETLRSLYEASDVLVFPSRFEGCAYVPLEAMAAGTPVVTGPTGAFADESRVFDGGRIVLADDPQAWAEAIREVLDAGDRLKPVRYVEENFSFATFSESYQAMAQSLISPSVGEVLVA